MNILERCRRCGHCHIDHQHYRPGSNCGLCGCPKFSARPWWVRLIMPAR